MLSVNQRKRSWSFPKGHLDEGETPLSCAKREIYEETGLSNLELIQDLGKYKRFKIGNDGKDDRSETKVIQLFFFITKEIELSPKDNHNPEAKWFSKDEALQFLTHEKDREFLVRVIQEYKIEIE